MVPRALRHALAFVLLAVAALSAGRRGPRWFSPLPEVPAAATPPVIVDVNTATRDQLEALPGIGPTLALRIVAGRSLRPYRRVDDLRRVRGIGERTLARLRERLRVGSEVAQEADTHRHGDEVGREVTPDKGERVGGLE